ncbi:MAG: xylose isomerase [Gammaproteobacteria bacterium]|nr:xylose isomerase [Gammaproteobacteria bacterium]
MTTEFFKNIPSIRYEGPETKNPFAYRYYDANKKILGKTMEEHLRLAICMWHTFCWSGQDVFGEGTFDRAWHGIQDPMLRAEAQLQAAFQFIEKLGLKYYTFHDRDVAPEGNNLKEFKQNLQIIADQMAKEMENKKIKLLWGTANLTHHRRYMAGAATNPNPEIFAYAVAQVKQTFDVTHQLKGENYVLWGGREGYDSLLNTDMKREQDQLGKFLSMLVDYKHKIGFKGTLLIEPKPCEPSKHQYDFDSATVFAFLQKYNLQNEFKVNIETNHATLAGHSFPHEVVYAISNGIFGSIDANQGDPQLGWDTDQFPMNLSDMTLALYFILQNGGFTTGGLNFDTKLRRQSVDIEDMFYSHIGGADNLARAFILATQLIEKNELQTFVKTRYAGWESELGQNILKGKMNFESIAALAFEKNLNPKVTSGRQELLENIVAFLE